MRRLSLPQRRVKMYSRILVANDGSPGGQKALSGAIELARKLSAELHMVTVEELPRFPASIDEIAEEKDEANHRFAPVIDAAKAGEGGRGGYRDPSRPRPRRQRGHRADQTAESGLSRRRLHGPFAALRAHHRRHHRSSRPLGALRGAGGKIARSDLLDIPHQEGRGGNDAFDVLAIGGLVRPLPGRYIRA